MEHIDHLTDAKGAAAFLRVSRSHLDALVRAGLPCHDATLPGRQRRRLRIPLARQDAHRPARQAAPVREVDGFALAADRVTVEIDPRADRGGRAGRDAADVEEGHRLTSRPRA